LKKQDESFKIDYFTDIESLKARTTDVLRSLLHQSEEESIFNLFSQIFRSEGNRMSLDRVQIISPRRVGNFGTMAINQNVIMNPIFRTSWYKLPQNLILYLALYHNFK